MCAMINAFDDAMNRIFADPSLAREAIYQKPGVDPITVRVIARQADQVLDFGDTRVHTGNSMFDVLVSDVLEPRPDDTLLVDGESYIVQGEPVRDPERLVWTLDVRPA
jgi:hypothetical protein